MFFVFALFFFRPAGAFIARRRLGKTIAVKTRLDCDVDDLLDEANALFFSVSPNPQKTRTLIAKLHDCANDARDAGYAEQEKKLRQTADELQQRLMAP
jgi:hypothetical protein